MPRAADGLWDLARNRVYVDAADLAREVNEALARSDELDFRSRLLIRDSITALEAQWGGSQVQDWINRHGHGSQIRAILESNEFTGETGFPSLRRRIMEPVKPEMVALFFRELSHHITKPVSLYVGGSIALVLAGRLSRPTDDINIVDEVPAEIREQHELRDEFIKRFGLQLAHFQSHYLPDGWKNRVRSFDVLGNLHVFLVDAYDVILGKMFSSRAKDRDDLVELAPQIDRELFKLRLPESGQSLLSEQKFREAAEKNWFTLFREPLPHGVL
jgi:hypothetical protein